jgi:hypothetical protein
MPLKQPLRRQWFRAIDCGIERDMDDALNRAVGRHKSVDIDTAAVAATTAPVDHPALSLGRRRLDDVVGWRSQKVAC